MKPITNPNPSIITKHVTVLTPDAIQIQAEILD
jgi:hypothetical protein